MALSCSRFARSADEANAPAEEMCIRDRGLPREVYDAGKSREQEENVDGAGEYYLRYLSCTTENGSAERRHAKEFLAEKFNMRPAGEAQ